MKNNKFAKTQWLFLGIFLISILFLVLGGYYLHLDRTLVGCLSFIPATAFFLVLFWGEFSNESNNV